MKGQDIIIIPSGGYNWASIQDAVKSIGYNASVSNDWKAIQKARKIILPGVGSAAHGIDALKTANLHHHINRLEQDVLGICLGMQLLFSSLEEDRATGLGVIRDSVQRIPSKNIVPHMGWNQLEFDANQNNGILKNVPSKSFVYFVHSYYAPSKKSHTLAVTNYNDISIAAIVKKENFYGVQFHPERSGEVGLSILNNFINL